MTDFVWPAPSAPVPLSDLLAARGVDATIINEGANVPPITAIAYDSRQVTPGALFVAVPGFHADGFQYIAPAIAAGAVAVVAPVERADDVRFLADFDHRAITFAVVPDVREALAHLAARFYDYPSDRLNVIGITGTDGKTTTTFLTSAVLEAAGRSTGLVGTVAFKIGPQWWQNPTRQTTLEAVETQALLAEMVRHGVQYAVVESSSHALALHKLADVRFDTAVLTNVTSEHLDFHGTVEEYRRAKSLLFASLGQSGGVKYGIGGTRHAIVNRDDPNAAMFINAALGGTAHIAVYTYGTGAAGDLSHNAIVLTARAIRADAHGTAYTLHVAHAETARRKPSQPEEEIRITLRLPGEFNVYNSMAAAAVGLAQRIDLPTIARGLAAVSGVPGRMETISAGQPFAVIVDYAHTAESLAKVLRILRPLTPGRLIVLFGSAGERDTTKRPAMGRVAAENADLAIFANEDPRLEDETAILRDIAAGAVAMGWREGERFWLIADRHAAIAHAFRLAQPGDTVLLAGKGHEQSIITGTTKVPYDERTAARTALHTLGYDAPSA